MNDQVKTAIELLFSDAVSVRNFVVGEAPELVKQYMEWHSFYNLSWAVIALFILVFMMIVIHKVQNSSLDYSDKPTVTVICIVITFFVFVLLLCSSFEYAKAKYFPKVFLMDKVISIGVSE